eukprot:m.496072 g.496072  ORF g.496072 m.496072 type:complete len:461 (+) comp46500_c0_seq1:119-1501(+)
MDVRCGRWTVLSRRGATWASLLFMLALLLSMLSLISKHRFRTSGCASIDLVSQTVSDAQLEQALHRFTSQATLARGEARPRLVRLYSNSSSNIGINFDDKNKGSINDNNDSSNNLLDSSVIFISLQEAENRRERLQGELALVLGASSSSSAASVADTTPSPTYVHPVPLSLDPQVNMLAERNDVLFRTPSEASVLLSHLRAVLFGMRQASAVRQGWVLVAEDDLGLFPVSRWPAPLSKFLAQCTAQEPAWEYINLACLSAVHWCPQAHASGAAHQHQGQGRLGENPTGPWDGVGLMPFAFRELDYCGADKCAPWQRATFDAARRRRRLAPLWFSAVAYVVRVTPRTQGLFACLGDHVLDPAPARAPPSFDQAREAAHRCWLAHLPPGVPSGYGGGADILTEYSDFTLPKLFGSGAYITTLPLFSVANKDDDPHKVHKSRTVKHTSIASITNALWILRDQY